MYTLREIEQDMARHPQKYEQLNPKKSPRKINQLSRSDSTANSSFNRSDIKKNSSTRDLAKQAHQRKTQTYEALKKWDQEREQMLGFHRRTINKLIDQVEKRIRQSQAYQQTLYQFLIDKCEQKRIYSQQPLKNPCTVADNNPVGSSLYFTHNNALRLCHSLSCQRQKIFREFTQRINKTLFQPLQSDSNEVQLQVTVMREKLRNLINDMHDKNTEASERCAQVAAYYKDKSASFRGSYDGMTLQEEFLKKAMEQTQAQKKLAAEAFGFLDVAIQTEMKRSGVIKRELASFIKLFREFEEVQLMSVEMGEQLNKDEERPLIEEFYSIDQLFDGETHKSLRKALGMKSTQALDIQILKSYLENLNYSRFDSEKLILKEFRGYYKGQDQDFNEMVLLITIDAFVHLYLAQVRQQNLTALLPKPPQFTFKLTTSIKIKQKSQTEVEFSCAGGQSIMKQFFTKKNKEPTQGFIFNVFFANLQQKLEFLDFVQTLLNN